MKTILSILFSLLLFSGFSQNNFGLGSSDGDYTEEESTLHQQEFFNYRSANSGSKSLSSYVIPVVVHIVHNNGPENISDQEVQEAINNLNSRFNGDYGGADCDIEFQLAKIDPNGDCTSGITRTLFNQPNVIDNNSYPNHVSGSVIRNLVNWPQENYLNIWIVKAVNGWRMGDDMDEWDDPIVNDQFVNIGWQVTRRGRPQWNPARDGVIIQYSVLNDGTFYGMDADAMLTRAVGAYLNLINVWGDGGSTTGCCFLDEESSDNSINRDLINDTPPCNYYSNNFLLYGFDNLMTHIASCAPILNCDNPDMCNVPLGTDPIPNPADYFPKDNYMTYNFNCMNKFTQGQAEWMWNSLDFYRPDLVSPSNLYATGVFYEAPSGITDWNSSDFVNGNVFVAESIVIPDGSTLNINNGVTVHFGGEAKLIIEKGGRVIINGATLTNFCEDLWKGIEVQGDRDLDQSPTSNQGYLRIINSTVENAECAVRLGKKTFPGNWGFDWTKTGGIVWASDAIFQNNVNDVEFHRYHNINDWSGNLQNNRSYFIDCEFLVNAPLNNGEDFLKERVKLTSVEGVRFTKCKFAVEGFGYLYYNSAVDRGTGILARDAGFIISGACSTYNFGSECESDDLTAQTLDDPNSDFIASSFENFRFGIKATAPVAGPPIKISQTIFDNNEFGAQFVNMHSTTLKRNKFRIPEGQFINYGAQFNGCKEYTIERNVFNNMSNNPYAANFGLNIINSGDQEHEAYLNDFDGLLAGIVVQQQNQNHNTTNGGNDSDVGLELRCNDFSNTRYDIGLTNNASIANLQGDYVTEELEPYAPAGNVFEPINSNSEADYFVSDDSEWFVYLHHDEGNTNIPYVKPESIDIQDVTNVSQDGVLYTTRAEACPVNGSSILSADINLGKVMEKRSIIEELNLDLNETVDGGNTIGLIDIINNSIYSDIEIRNTLQQISPYLSNAVLTACIERADPLNVWVLCEIMLANSPLHFSVLEVYENELPLPQQLDNLLWLYQSGSSTMNVMKSQIKSQVRSKERALNAYTEDVAFAEDSDINEARREILEGEESNRRIRTLVALDIQEENFTSASALVDSYEANSTDDNFKEYLTLYLSLDKSEGYSLVTEAQTSDIRAVAESGGTMKIAAAALLEELTGEILYPEAVAPSESTKALITNPKERVLDKLVTLFPNPANSYFYVTYVLPVEFTSASLEIYDLKGSLVNKIDVSNGIGMEYVDSQNLSDGTYITVFLVDGKKVSEEKITIVK